MDIIKGDWVKYRNDLYFKVYHVGQDYLYDQFNNTYPISLCEKFDRDKFIQYGEYTPAKFLQWLFEDQGLSLDDLF